MKHLFKLFISATLAISMFYSCTEESIIEPDIQVATQDLSNIGLTTATGSGYVTVDKASSVIKRGFCWSETSNPTLNDSVRESSDTITAKAYTVQLIGLKPATVYYARAFASDGISTSYGNELTFRTKDAPTQGWCVIDNVSGITPTMAKIKMEIADDGGSNILEFGICYNTSGAPTLNDVKLVSDPGGARFSPTISNLSQNTKYYVRPYFITSQGITFGETIEFSTLNFVRSANAFPGYQAAYLMGEVVMDAGSATSERGICWGTTNEPTLENGHYKVEGKGVGSFNLLIGGLTKGTTYFMRAYAKNDDGTFYGLPVQFTTKSGNIMPGAYLSDMLLVEKGTFSMGEPNTMTVSSLITANTFGKEPVHQVEFSKNFYMNKYEITNDQICAFLNVFQSTSARYNNLALYNSSGRTFAFNVSGSLPNLVYVPVNGCGRKPAANITWACAYEYCRWLSAELGVTVRIPTEAEWEYAARGGKNSQGYIYSGSNTRANVGVFTTTALGPKNVGSLAPNELGIYDMSGNVFEYCLDYFDMDFYLGQVGTTTVDPLKTGAANGSKPIRGGSFRHETYQRVSARGKCNNEADCGTHSGMRIVLERIPGSL